MFVNPRYINSLNQTRSLQEEEVVEDPNAVFNLNDTSFCNETVVDGNSTECVKNTTWIIEEQGLPPVELPDPGQNLEYDASWIDENVFDVFIEPSQYQDISKVNFTWETVSLDENQLEI